MYPLVRRLRQAYVAARIRRTQPFVPPVLVHDATERVPRGGVTHFDEERAFALLEEQCRFGPRIPGTAAHRACREYLVSHLSASARRVAVQEWAQRIERGPGAGSSVPLCNLLALIPGRRDDGVPADRIHPALMLAAHWDTRPVADHDPQPGLRGLPVPGASDGASGVAVLLELARVMAADPPPASVAIALFDGEDLGEYYYGSRYFGRWASHPALAPWRPQRAIVVDMIGGRGLACTRELNSIEQAPDLWREVESCARELGEERHFRGDRRRISDDHLMLSRAGIPSILLIDFSYRYWHTTSDTPEKCAPGSLGVIGRVLQRLVGGVPVPGAAPRNADVVGAER